MLAGQGWSTHVIYHALAASFPIDAVVLESKVSTRLLLQRRVKKLGLPVVAGQVLFMAAIVPLLARSSGERIRQIIRDHQLETGEIPADKLVPVDSVNSAVVIQELRRRAPSVVVVNGTRIIGKEVLTSTGAVFINIHAGITPEYRGVHGAYWALASGDTANCGVTIHRVDTGIDTGPVIAQAAICPTPFDNFVTYPWLQVAAAVAPLRQAVQQALAGNLEYLPRTASKSRLWSHPTAWQYLKNYALRRVR